MNGRLKRFLRWLLLVPGVLVLAVAGFVVWGLTPLGPTTSALDALRSDASVRVTHAEEGWVFAPVSGEATRGLVFYPGGHVDSRSYAPYARAVAARGFLVVVPPMPLSLAVLDPGAADHAIDAHPEITGWTMGGHSLGGAMAAQYAGGHLDTIDGLILLAAYPPDTADLSASGLTVGSLVGTQDSVIRRQALRDTKRLLPVDTRYVEIAGGNHAQFGDYGPQPRDTPQPELRPAEQLAAAVDETVHVLQGGPEK